MTALLCFIIVAGMMLGGIAIWFTLTNNHVSPPNRLTVEWENEIEKARRHHQRKICGDKRRIRRKP